VILLDTHAWYWWLALPERLSVRAQRAIDAASSVAISPLSCWELAMLVRVGRIALDRDPRAWVRQALATEGVVVADVHPAAATAAGLLPDEFPGDPMDRILYATAVELDAPLVTKDRRLHAAAPDRALW
jgi:PIN domain nuclease of toxin-antitoxin system